MSKPHTAVEAVSSKALPAASGVDITAILHDPETWIIVAFAIFFGIFAKLVMPMILKGLDSRADKIRDQLEQANRLRAQAQELLATYQAEREAKMKEAEQIITSARHDAEALRARAAAELTQALERRSQQAMEKITRAEQEAITFIRSQMIDVASQSAAEIVRTQLSAKGAEDPAIASALTAIEQQIH